MKEVLLKTIYAGPTQTAGPNTVITVSDAEAEQLIGGGYAELVRLVPVEGHEAQTDAGSGEVVLSSQNDVVEVAAGGKGKAKKK